VLDNTYLSRAARSDVLGASERHGAAVRCIWLDTPLAQAQINLVERLLDRVGALPEPDELRDLARAEPGLMAPTSQMRTARELEPPGDDEGFAEIEWRPFARGPRPRGARAGVFLAAGAASPELLAQADPQSPHLVFGWSPSGDRAALDSAAARVAAAVGGPITAVLCPHPGGPPRCWCRPPLPGLLLAFAREHGVDPGRSVLAGTGPAHRSLAAALGARYLEP
jgi:hypothetical protein